MSGLSGRIGEYDTSRALTTLDPHTRTKFEDLKNHLTVNKLSSFVSLPLPESARFNIEEARAGDSIHVQHS